MRDEYLLNDKEFDCFVIGMVSFQSIRVSHHILTNPTVIFFCEDLWVNDVRETILLAGALTFGMERSTMGQKSLQIFSRSHHHLNDRLTHDREVCGMLFSFASFEKLLCRPGRWIRERIKNREGTG